MNKKALLTGVAGFVGSHMAAYLLKKGFQVIGIDNMSQGFERNLTELKSNKNFSFHNIDVCNFDAMMKVSENLTHIVHTGTFPSCPVASQTFWAKSKMLISLSSPILNTSLSEFSCTNA
jgi:nucleoside-diphosphate-sugar epimerase